MIQLGRGGAAGIANQLGKPGQHTANVGLAA